MTKSIAYTIAVLALAGAACGDDDDDNGDNQGTPTQPGTEPVSDRVVSRADIVSDQPGAGVTDENLVNAWGLAFNPMGAAWVSATETGISLVYDAQGNELIPAVAMPPSAEQAEGSPTGQIFNADTRAFGGDRFIFVTEQGTISGWDLSDGTEAVMRVDNSESEAIYKGVASALDPNGLPMLFAADFHGAKVDVFNASYAPITTSGGFVDAELPSGFAPFNIESVDGLGLIVAYAMQDEEMEDDVKGAGLGYVDLFDIDGELMARLISGGELNAPWGIVMTPDTFEPAPNRLLVGNFGDGLIHVYQMVSTTSVEYEGPLRDSSDQPLAIDGLWALEFGVDAGGFRSDQLYFTAGPDDETHGVFGRLEADALEQDSNGNGAAGTGAPPNGSY